MTSKGYFALTGLMAVFMALMVAVQLTWAAAGFGVCTGGMLVVALFTLEEERADAEIIALAEKRLGDEGNGKLWRMVFMDEDGNVME